MALAETAQLAVNLTLGGNFNAGLSEAEGRLSGFNAAAAGAGTRTSALSGAFSTVSRAASGVGGALNHAGSQIKNLVTGPLGILGLTGGLLSFGGAIEQSIGRAQEEGAALEKLTLLTGDSAESLSAFLAVTERYGIATDRVTKVIGIATRNVETIGKSAKTAAAFQQQFGFSVLDSAGHVKDFNALLTSFTDYYSKNTNEVQRNAAAAKLFGRSYTDLLPILALGSKGLADAEEAAKEFGLTLTAQNVQDLAKARQATRDWGDALHGLELQIGVNLLPEITGLAKSATSFVKEHGPDIIKFFKDAADFAGNAASTIGGLASAAGQFWNGIPAPLRDLLVKGLVADRTVKFLFGFDPVASLGKSLLGNIGGSFLSRGSSPANPMWVASTGGIGGPGGPGGAGLGLLGGVFGLATVAAIEAGLAEWVRQQVNPNSSGDIFQPRSPNPYHAEYQGLPNAIDLANTEARNAIAGHVDQHSAQEILSATQLVAINTKLEAQRAEAIATSSESQKQKLADLTAIQRDIKAHGDRTTQARINALISEVRHQKPPIVSINIPIRIIGGQAYRVTATTFASMSGYSAPIGVRQKT